MIASLGLWISRVFRACAPDPWVTAVALTLLTAILGLCFGDFVPRQGAQPLASDFGGRCLALLDAWRSDDGIWYFLKFSMQMCLILVTGHALAASRPVRRLLESLARMPRSTASAAALVGSVACCAAIINWGLGLIAGAILAREVGRSMTQRRVPVHYPLIVAAGYTGLMVWHGGLSGSAPLSMTTLSGAKSVLREEYLARLGPDLIPLHQTLFAPFNLIISGGMLILVPVVLAALAPRHVAQFVPAPTALAADDATGSKLEDSPTIPDWLERSWPVAAILAMALAASVWRYASTRGFAAIGLNEINAAFLAIGLLLHGSLRSYAAAAEEGARGCAGIMLQFPLYGGIMAMMVASGLVREVSDLIVRVSTPDTLPVNTFFSAAVLNLFIPSGGGQWGVQGPIAMASAFELGVSPGRLVMAVAYGDQLTNMLQPFWALPLLAITGARARDIVGYTCIVMLAGGAWITAGLLLF